MHFSYQFLPFIKYYKYFIYVLFIYGFRFNHRFLKKIIFNMPKNCKRNTQTRDKDAKSCVKVPSRKMTRLENARQNIFKSLTNSVNQNLPEFVLLNKKEALKNLSRKTLGKIKEFQNYNNFLFKCSCFVNFMVFMI